MARIVIIQPYVPAYRAPFFEALGKDLAERNHVLTIVSGVPSPDSRRRRDSVRLESVTHRVVPIPRLRLGPFELRLGPLRSSWSDADVVIVELAAGSVPSYRALLGGVPTGVWGHVGSYVSKDSSVTRTLRRWQVRRAQHVIAYTEQGAVTARSYGALPSNVTALGNTVDTRALRAELQIARQEPDESVRQDLGAPPGPLFAMIGASTARNASTSSKRCSSSSGTLTLRSGSSSADVAERSTGCSVRGIADRLSSWVTRTTG